MQTTDATENGLLLIDKPNGWSSFDVVRKLRPQLGIKKIGHAGTLDPLATGLLILLLGRATKQQQQFMQLRKRYEATITLGATSDTDDAEGTISHAAPLDKVEPPTRTQIERALQRFTGDIEQIPPQYSAVKLQGQRAYQAARRGETVGLQPRRVTVYELRLIDYQYPHMRMHTQVSSGTYIRSLARDIGAALAIGGYVSQLRRTHIGDYSVEAALTPGSDAETLRGAVQPL